MGKIDPNKVPEGYEVDTDMFGFPFLRRKYTPLERKLSAAFSCLFVIGVLGFAIWFFARLLFD